MTYHDINDEDDLNDGLDDCSDSCYPPYSSYPYHGPWNISKTALDYLVEAHKRELSTIKGFYQTKIDELEAKVARLSSSPD